MSHDQPVATEDLAMLQQQASVCTACRLAETRTQVVFSRGMPSARVMVIGEAPGFHEDQQGFPFVGPAGKLLDTLLGEIGLGPDDVYVANILKCRPPGNRDPRDDEIDACKGWLRRQLELVDPEVVVTVGNFSTKLLLKTESGISRLRGRAYPWWRRQLVPTYHPAAALRGGDRVLTAMREDLALVRRLLDLAPSPAEADNAVAEPVQMELFGA
jgi:DNA polymerase